MKRLYTHAQALQVLEGYRGIGRQSWRQGRIREWIRGECVGPRVAVWLARKYRVRVEYSSQQTTVRALGSDE